jgi:hypothetical protein
MRLLWCTRAVSMQIAYSVVRDRKNNHSISNFSLHTIKLTMRRYLSFDSHRGAAADAKFECRIHLLYSILMGCDAWRDVCACERASALRQREDMHFEQTPQVTQPWRLCAAHSFAAASSPTQTFTPTAACTFWRDKMREWTLNKQVYVLV